MEESTHILRSLRSITTNSELDCWDSAEPKHSVTQHCDKNNEFLAHGDLINFFKKEWKWCRIIQSMFD